MRTKLLLTAACVAGLTAMAQVYSVNVVGYVNLTLTNGFTMIANPLDAGAGNNVVDNLLATGLPDGTMLYKFTGATYQIATYYVVGDQSMWDPAGLTLEPGEGAFIRIPGTTPVTITFVGEVKQGTLTTPVPAGYSIKSSQVPQRALLSKDTSMPTDTLNLGFPAADGDMIYKWLPVQKKYEIDTFYVSGADTLWDPQAPMIEVGESFFVRKMAAVDWVRVFNVSQ